MAHTLFLALTSLAYVSMTLPLVKGQVQSTIWSVYDFPDPRAQNIRQQTLCGRLNVSSVCDPDGLISVTDANHLDELINDVYTNTDANCVGGQGFIIRVAIMPQMERVRPEGENTTIGRLRDARLYAYILSTRWKMEGACEETVLILYSQADRILYTLTRPGARRVLNDDNVKTISMKVRDYFDDANTVYEGLREMIRRYKLVFDGNWQQAIDELH